MGVSVGSLVGFSVGGGGEGFVEGCGEGILESCPALKSSVSWAEGWFTALDVGSRVGRKVGAFRIGERVGISVGDKSMKSS